MKSLRKRRVAKQYGVRFINNYKRQWWYFRNNRGGLGFYFGNDATFLNVVKNQSEWGNPSFKYRTK